MLFESGDRIVFTGDSVTDDGRARPVGEGLAGTGNGYVRAIENLLNVIYPEKKFWISNTGCGGNTSRDLKNRWQSDVLNLNPQWVSVMIGINDIWRQYDCPTIPAYAVSLEEYRENLTEIIEKTVPHVKGMIIMSPYYMELNREDAMRKTTDEYIAVCKEVAEKYGCVYIDIQKAFDEFLVHRYPASISWDRVHPGHTGSMLIARELLKGVGIDRQLF